MLYLRQSWAGRLSAPGNASATCILNFSLKFKDNWITEERKREIAYLDNL